MIRTLQKHNQLQRLDSFTARLPNVTARSAALGLVLALIVSALIRIHSDKRRYDESVDFPYPRIPKFADQCSGDDTFGCVVDGIHVRDPVWNNATGGECSTDFRALRRKI